MKKIGFIVCLVFLAACFSKKHGGPELPVFNILLPDSVTVLNTSKIPTGNPIVLVYFSPDCEHCQAETEWILHHMDSLKKVNFYFVTNDPLDRLQIFYKAYGMDRHPNIVVGRDYEFAFIRLFKGISPPYTILYDRDKHERRVFSGSGEIDQLPGIVNKL